jgi:hypothetical protein
LLLLDPPTGVLSAGVTAVALERRKAANRSNTEAAMNSWRIGQGLLALAWWLGVSAASAQALLPQSPAIDLAGTSWQLVIFQGLGDRNLIPDERAKYTIDFSADGQLNARIDCSVAHGTWMSPGPSQLRLGPLAFTSTCATGSLRDQIVKDWTDVRLYVIRNGRLFLSVAAAEGSLYAFEPNAVAPRRSQTLPVASKGPVQYACVRAGRNEMLTATFYDTAPATVVIARGNLTRSAFLVPGDKGSKYQGEDLVFWDTNAEANVNWSGTELTCAPR